MRRPSHPIRALMLFTFMLIAVGGIACFAMGWVSFEQTNESASIKINTGEIKEAANDVVESGEELIKDTGEALEDVGGKLNSDKKVEESKSEAEKGEAGAKKAETESSTDIDLVGDTFSDPVWAPTPASPK